MKAVAKSMNEGLNRELKIKLQDLIKWFKEQGKVIVALSGGVDSSVVAALAKQALGDNAIAVTVKSSTLPEQDLREAIKVTQLLGIRHILTEHDELSNPKVAENPPERCYYCRSELMSTLKNVALKYGVETIVDGTNADDLNAHRPGVIALREGGARSPLAENKIGKDEVRMLAKLLGLPNADKPSNACLASRFPYGQRITKEGLERVAMAEEVVRNVTGARQVRVRDHSSIARIEVGKEERRLLFSEEVLDRLAERLKALGFHYVTFDLEGYRSGSMDEVLNRKIVPYELCG